MPGDDIWTNEQGKPQGRASGVVAAHLVNIRINMYMKTIMFLQEQTMRNGANKISKYTFDHLQVRKTRLVHELAVQVYLK